MTGDERAFLDMTSVGGIGTGTKEKYVGSF